MIKFITAAACLLLFSCAGKHNHPAATSATATTILQIDERLNNTDSLVFSFYKDPYGEDSVRYSRFFTQYSSTVSSDIQLVVKSLDTAFTKHEQVKKCRSEGKIWCFANGKIFQTIYFSANCPNCCFLYILKDGFFYYAPIHPNMIQRLASLKSAAR
jgi:hypothetical protein